MLSSRLFQRGDKDAVPLFPKGGNFIGCVLAAGGVSLFGGLRLQPEQ